MIFQTINTYIDYIEEADMERIVEIYNSNKIFLHAHMGKESVNVSWVKNEIEEMKGMEFKSCKIVSKDENEIIGFVDFKVEENSYLSLLMVHEDFKGKGFGREVYNGLEAYMKDKSSESVRIDVVTGYNGKVTKFWYEQGFRMTDEIKLEWDGKELTAIVMKKSI